MTTGKFQPGNRRGGKLTAGQVRQMRELYAGGEVSQGQLARDFGISIGQVGRIIREEVWQDLGSVPLTADTLARSQERILQAQEEVNREQELAGRLERDIAEAKAESTPGETKADRMLEELDEESRERLKQLRGEGG